MIGARLRERFVIERGLGEGAGRARWAARDERGRSEIEVWTVGGVVDPGAWLTAVGKARLVPGQRRVIEHGCQGDVGWIAYTAAPPGPRVEAERPMALEHVIGWARAVTAAMEAAARAGLVHGGFVVDDVAAVGADLKIGGLGLWSALDAAALVSAWGADAWQLAPEVRAGRARTAATDAWSMALGAARLAFGDHGDAEALVARARAAGPNLGELFEAALSDDPARRPTAGGFVEVLVRIARLGANPTPTPTPSPNPNPKAVGAVADPDSETAIGPPPSAPAPAPPRLIAISHSGELQRPRTAQRPAIPEAPAPEPPRPRVQLKPISEAMPPAFSTREGALGYLAPPAPRRAPTEVTAAPSRRLLVIVGSAAVVVLIAAGLIAALAR